MTEESLEHNRLEHNHWIIQDTKTMSEQPMISMPGRSHLGKNHNRFYVIIKQKIKGISCRGRNITVQVQTHSQINYIDIYPHKIPAKCVISHTLFIPKLFEMNRATLC